MNKILVKSLTNAAPQRIGERRLRPQTIGHATTRNARIALKESGFRDAMPPSTGGRIPQSPTTYSGDESKVAYG
jgi:hypothetical protein